MERGGATRSSVPRLTAPHIRLAEVEGIALKGGLLPEVPAGDLVRNQPQPGVMAGVVHHAGAVVLAGVKPRSSAPRSSPYASPASTRTATRLSRLMSVQRWLLTTEYGHSAVPSHTYHSGVRCGPSWLPVAIRHVRCFVRKAPSSALLMAILRAR